MLQEVIFFLLDLDQNCVQEIILAHDYVFLNFLIFCLANCDVPP